MKKFCFEISSDYIMTHDEIAYYDNNDIVHQKIELLFKTDEQRLYLDKASNIYINIDNYDDSILEIDSNEKQVNYISTRDNDNSYKVPVYYGEDVPKLVITRYNELKDEL
jgi:hypothetical protein